MLTPTATIKATLPASYNPAHPAVILSATALSGATDLSGWTIAGYPAYAPFIQNGTNVVIQTRVIHGTYLLFK